MNIHAIENKLIDIEKKVDLIIKYLDTQTRYFESLIPTRCDNDKYKHELKGFYSASTNGEGQPHLTNLK